MTMSVLTEAMLARAERVLTALKPTAGLHGAPTGRCRHSDYHEDSDVGAGAEQRRSAEEKKWLT
jgi:hypothetical protein